MKTKNPDPLLDKLHALPVLAMNSARAGQTLRAAEEALSEKVRPGIRWPRLALSVALSLAGTVYTVDSVHKLGDIYRSNRVASADIER